MRNRKARKDLTMMRGKAILLLMVGLVGLLGWPVMSLGGETRELRETTVQIMGRSCEYDAAEIEEAVRRFGGIKEVRFIHERGRVLIRYQSGMASPEQLVEAVERAMVMGWNCHARIARSG
jgi:copper chaperone CopZ